MHDVKVEKRRGKGYVGKSLKRLGKNNRSMLTIYWTVELDFRFCPQAKDEFIDEQAHGWVVQEREGKIK